MAVYCISDVHGHFSEFVELVEAIGFSEGDTLWVLGDIIDRGDESLQMLLFAIECSEGKHGDIRFLLGNHELMMYETLMRRPGEFVFHKSDDWITNGGIRTAKQIRAAMPPEWLSDTLVPWIESLPFYKVIEVNGEKWMLVHAGFDPGRYDTVVEDGVSGIDVGYGFGVQEAWRMVWAREEWMEDYYDAPLPTVHGHTMTPTITNEMGAFEAKLDSPVYCEGGILFYLNKIDIDCGAGMGSKLGCLRLDDFAEFYVDVA